MRKLAALFIFVLPVLIAGCSEQTAAPMPAFRSSDRTEAKAVESGSAEPTEHYSPGEDKKPTEWITNRLVEISRRYFSQLEEAQNKGLPFEAFRENLQRYMTDRFIEQEQLEQYYKGGEGLTRLFLIHYQPGTLKARTTILEQTDNRIVVKTMRLANDLNSGYYEVSTLVYSGGDWLLDEKRREDMPKGGFQLTTQEAATYLQNDPYAAKPFQSVKYVGNKTLAYFHGEFALFYQFDCDGETYYISPVDGYVLASDLKHY